MWSLTGVNSCVNGSTIKICFHPPELPWGLGCTFLPKHSAPAVMTWYLFLVLPFPECHVNGATQHMGRRVRLPLASVRPSPSIPLFGCAAGHQFGPGWKCGLFAVSGGCERSCQDTVSSCQVFILTHVFSSLRRYPRGRLPRCLRIERGQNVPSPDTHIGLRITLS